MVEYPCMQANLKQILTQLDFTANETAVYLAIQKHGQIPATELSHITNINRTTVYSVAKALIDRGLIKEEHRGGKRFFIASSPDALGRVVRKEQEKLNKKKELVNTAMKQVQDIERTATVPVPKVQYILGEQIEEFLYRRTPVWNESILASDGSYLGFQEPEFPKRFAAWIDWYWNNAPKMIKLILFSNQTEAEIAVANKGYEQRKIIEWKNKKHFTSTLWVMGDYVVLFSLTSKPERLVEIHDAAFAESQREIFRAMLEEYN